MYKKSLCFKFIVIISLLFPNIYGKNKVESEILGSFLYQDYLQEYYLKLYDPSIISSRFKNIASHKITIREYSPDLNKSIKNEISYKFMGEITIDINDEGHLKKILLVDKNGTPVIETRCSYLKNGKLKNFEDQTFYMDGEPIIKGHLSVDEKEFIIEGGHYDEKRYTYNKEGKVIKYIFKKGDSITEYERKYIDGKEVEELMKKNGKLERKVVKQYNGQGLLKDYKYIQFPGEKIINHKQYIYNESRRLTKEENTSKRKDKNKKSSVFYSYDILTNDDDNTILFSKVRIYKNKNAKIEYLYDQNKHIKRKIYYYKHKIEDGFTWKKYRIINFRYKKGEKKGQKEGGL